jgi:hypothetical protein
VKDSIISLNVKQSVAREKKQKKKPKCIQHGGTVAEVEKKETIATTKKVKIVKKSKKGQVPSRVQPKRAMKEAKKNQE